MLKPVDLVSLPSSPRTSVPTLGPMSVGIVNLPLSGNEVQPRNDATEHICMFSACLMFIGVPIIVAGILFLSFLSPLGVVLIAIGVVASVSGAILALLSAIMSVFTKSSNVGSVPSNYVLNDPPQVSIDRTGYSNQCGAEATPQQLSATNLPTDPNSGYEILDPHLWTNFLEAQNPKAYLNSFGDLPRIIPSPKPLPPLEFRGSKSNNFRKFDKKSKPKLPNIKIEFKRKSLSRTELTKDSLDEIRSTSSSSDSSPINVAALNHYLPDESGSNNWNGNIITIENFNLQSNDSNVDESDNLNTKSSETKDENTISNNQIADSYSEEFERIDAPDSGIKTVRNLMSPDLDNYLNTITNSKKEEKTSL